MFTTAHLIWLCISVVFVIVTTVLLRKRKPPFKKVLTAACIAAVIAEMIKIFSVIKLVPSGDGSNMYMYLEPNNLPLHLCSIQIIFIFFVRFAKDGPVKDAVFGFMYPTCSLGAFLALMMPTIFSSSTTIETAFLRGQPYEYFIYHSFLVIFGLHIYYSKKEVLRPKHYVTSLGLLGALAFCSLYFNSMFSTAVYENGELISVEKVTNFFFTYDFAIDIKFTEVWHWYIYIASIFAVACVALALFYIPVFVRYFKKKKSESVEVK